MTSATRRAGRCCYIYFNLLTQCLYLAYARVIFRTFLSFSRFIYCLRNFEIKQMSYFFNIVFFCNERKLEMKMAAEKVCRRCNVYKIS